MGRTGNITMKGRNISSLLSIFSEIRGMRILASILVLSIFFSGCDWTSLPQTAAWRKISQTIKLAQAPNRGMKFFNAGRYEEAIDIWLEELRMDPQNPTVHNNIGIAYRRLGDSQTAISYLNKAVELKPRYGRYYYNLGLVHYDLKEFAQAKQNFLKALELEYIHADVHYSLGQAHKSLGDFAQAEIAFQKVIELNASYPGAHYQLAECYGQFGKFDLAKAEYKTELEKNPRWESSVKEALLKMDTRIHPKNPDAFFALGRVYKDGRTEENLKNAMEAFHQVAKLRPSYPEAHLQLGELYEKRGDFWMANYEYRQEINFYSKSEKALSALQRLKGKMEKAIDPAKFFGPHSSFEGIAFPQEGVVAVERADLYDESYLRKGELPKGKILQIRGVCDRAMKKNDHGPYQFFYILGNKKDLINTRDVILKSCYLSPAYVSPAKKIQIIKNPAAHLMEEKSSARHFSLWLKVEGRGPLFLGNYAEQRADDLKRFITGSADERYLFIGFLRKVLSSDGAVMVVLNDLYTSPVWYEDMLFLRGRGENDAVYSLNMKTKEFKKFLEVSRGLRCSEGVKGEMLTWDPVTVENGLVNVSFTRIDLHPTEKGKHCMTIAITADRNGRTVKENIRWDPCNS